MPDTPDRIPPQAIEAEQHIIGACITDPECRAIALEQLQADYFYDPRHQEMFRAVKHLAADNTHIDQVTLIDRLKEVGQYEDIGIDYIYTVTGQVSTPESIQSHIRLIINASIKYSLAFKCGLIGDKSQDPYTDPDELLGELEGFAGQLRDRQPIGNRIIPASSLMQSRIDELGKINRKEIEPGLKSGLVDLDALTLGFQPSDLIVIGGRPSDGKTSLGLNIIEHVALVERTPVLLFSLEMARFAIIDRLLCAKARISSHDIKSGRVVDWEAINDASKAFSEVAEIHVDDSAILTIGEIRSRTQRVIRQHQVGLIVIDYLQLATSPGAQDKRIETGEISGGLKALAKDVKLPVIALSQLKRLDKGKDRRPELQDLRESGAIEADADVVIFVWRKADSHGIKGNEGEIILAKQRNGPTGVIESVFIKEYTRWECKARTGDMVWEQR